MQKMQNWQALTMVLFFLGMTGVYLAFGMFSGMQNVARVRLLGGNETNWTEEVTSTWMPFSSEVRLGIGLLWFTIVAMLPFWLWLYLEFDQ